MVGSKMLHNKTLKFALSAGYKVFGSAKTHSFTKPSLAGSRNVLSAKR
jgi:hypothetical protein